MFIMYLYCDMIGLSSSYNSTYPAGNLVTTHYTPVQLWCTDYIVIPVTSLISLYFRSAESIQPEEMSVYDIKDHPEYRFRPGHVVVRVGGYDVCLFWCSPYNSRWLNCWSVCFIMSPKWENAFYCKNIFLWQF